MTFETNLYPNNKINKTRPITKTIQASITTHTNQLIPSNRLIIRRQLNKVNRVSNFDKAASILTSNKQIQANRISVQAKKRHPKNPVILSGNKLTKQ